MRDAGQGCSGCKRRNSVPAAGLTLSYANEMPARMAIPPCVSSSRRRVSSSRRSTNCSTLHDPQIAAALRAIHADPARQWTVEELGQRAGLSRAAFARRFTGLVGQPPLTYLTWWRMTTAAGFLLRSDAPLSAVARRIGYTSEFAFATAFKRAYGMAPGTYRRRRPSPPDVRRRHPA